MEGIEGSGKSTLAAALAEALRARGLQVIMTREPGGTPLGEAVRSIFLHRPLSIAPLSEAMLLSAARAQHVDDVIAPARAAGTAVLCDRYALATLAYQGYGRGVPLAVLRTLNEAATRGYVPDATFVLDVPVDVSIQRLHVRGQASGAPHDRVEREEEAFHERVRAGYLELAKSEPNVVVLDGLRAPADLAREALRALPGTIF